MSTTPALDSYKRVITSKRDGICHACGAPTRSGVDFAAVDTVGKWFPFCATCAGSYAAQISHEVEGHQIGLLPRVEAAAATADADVVAALVLPNEAEIIAVLQGRASVPQSIAIVAALHALLVVLSRPTAATVDPRIAPLRAIAAGDSKDRSFAQSLVGQYDSKGSLSEKQWACVDRMVVVVTSGPVAPVEVGLYLATDGAIYKGYMTQNDRLGVKQLHVHPGVGEANDTGSFEYLKGGVRVLGGLLGAGTARKLTEAEGKAFGKLHGFCCNCARDLDDDRSLVAGYGPKCASNLGWWYPSKAEAAAILARPTEVPEADGTY